MVSSVLYQRFYPSGNKGFSLRFIGRKYSYQSTNFRKILTNGSHGDRKVKKTKKTKSPTIISAYFIHQEKYHVF